MNDILRSVTMTRHILDRNDAGVSYEVWPDDKGVTVRTYDEDSNQSAEVDLFWEEVPDVILVLTLALRNRPC